jgi:hypothetical protein
MGLSQQRHAGHQQSSLNGSPISGAALLQDAGGAQDSVSNYFECITACSIDDGECVTHCVEVLREQQ